MSSLTREQVEAFISRVSDQQEQRGYTLWATSLKSGEFIGFIGLNYTDWPSHFTPAVEVGWRLASQHWGNGYATEGAKAAIDYGFKHCDLSEIVSFTVPGNYRLIRVMEKLGMQKDIDGDFAHPKIPATHALSRQVLYRLKRDAVIS